MTSRQKVYLFSVLLFVAGLFPLAHIHASTDFPVIDKQVISLEGTTLQKGYTISAQSKEVRIGVPSNSSLSPYAITATAIDGYPGTSRSNELHVGPVVDISFVATLTNPLTLQINVQRNNRHFRVWIRRWNEKAQTWDRIPNTIDDLHQWVTAKITQPGIYTSFESTTVQEGKASWFKSSKKMVAAHNFYPIGTKIQVTNLQNKKTVIVKIVSSGPFVVGRAVDLSYDAFRAIGKTGGGVLPVSITAVGNAKATQGVVLGEIVTQPTTQSLPSVTFDKTETYHEVSGIRTPAYVAIQQQTGTIVVAKNAQAVRSLASMTKLMTAMVVLDTHPDMNSVMTYTEDDNADGAKLYIAYGEKIKVKDLFYASLVGSANNATKLLSRASGLTKAEFVSRMNKKAAELGLSHTSFYEPTGLEQDNVSTPYEFALLARQAFAYPDIAKATLTTSYSFTTAGTKQKHTITNKDRMLKSGWTLAGIKTGFTDEAQYCLVSSVVGKTSKIPVIAVTMGSPTDAIRYADMDKILSQAFTFAKI